MGPTGGESSGWFTRAVGKGTAMFDAEREREFLVAVGRHRGAVWWLARFVGEGDFAAPANAARWAATRFTGFQHRAPPRAGVVPLALDAARIVRASQVRLEAQGCPAAAEDAAQRAACLRLLASPVRTDGRD